MRTNITNKHALARSSTHHTQRTKKKKQHRYLTLRYPLQSRANALLSTPAQ
jgi:hypothetical protein